MPWAAVELAEQPPRHFSWAVARSPGAWSGRVHAWRPHLQARHSAAPALCGAARALRCESTPLRDGDST